MMELKKLNKEQQIRINFLRTRVSDLEQHTRINGMIISGHTLKPRSYAHVLKAGVREDNEHGDSIEDQVTGYKGIHMKGTAAYINEHFTKMTVDLARRARFLKKH